MTNISDAIWFLALAIMLHGCMTTASQKINVICETIEKTDDKPTND